MVVDSPRGWAQGWGGGFAMCIGCYEGYGAPRIVTPQTIAMGERMRDADGFGALHIVIEDMNLYDDDIEGCRNSPYSKPANAEELTLIDDMLAMTLDERVSAYALGDGWLLPNGELSEWAAECLGG